VLRYPVGAKRLAARQSAGYRTPVHGGSADGYPGVPGEAAAGHPGTPRQGWPQALPHLYDVCGSANATSLSAPTRTANRNGVGTRGAGAEVPRLGTSARPHRPGFLVRGADPIRVGPGLSAWPGVAEPIQNRCPARPVGCQCPRTATRRHAVVEL
jgi:hypothetical protein